MSQRNEMALEFPVPWEAQTTVHPPVPPSPLRRLTTMAAAPVCLTLPYGHSHSHDIHLPHRLSSALQPQIETTCPRMAPLK